MYYGKCRTAAKTPEVNKIVEECLHSTENEEDSVRKIKLGGFFFSEETKQQSEELANI